MVMSVAAVQMHMVAQPWLAYRLSGSGMALGLVAGSWGLTMLLFSPLGGAVADRVDRQRVLGLSQLLLCLLALVNAALVVTERATIWQLVGIGLVQGAVFSINAPARQAYIPDLVREEDLPRALALDAMGMNMSRVLGPSLVGVLLATDHRLAFLGVAVLFGVAGVLVRALPSASPQAPVAGPVREVVDGVRYVMRNRQLLAILGMAFVPVILGLPFQQLLPIFQAEVLGVGPSLLGLMYTAVGVGSVLGSMAAVWLAASPQQGRFLVLAGAAFGLGLLTLALSRWYVVTVAVLALVGAASQGYLTVNRVVLMTSAERAYHGRLMSLYFMTFSLMPVATVPMGAMADVVGAPTTVGGAGALLLGFMVAVAVLYPTLWRGPGRKAA